MSVAEAGLNKALWDFWQSSGMNAEHVQYWDDSERNAFVSLEEGAATDHQPFPYTVYEAQDPTVENRSSGNDKDSKFRVLNVPFQFRIYARKVAGTTKTPKEIAELIAKKLCIKLFGGEEEKQQILELTVGCHLQTQYVSDFAVKEDDDVHGWIVNCTMLLDMPYKVA